MFFDDSLEELLKVDNSFEELLDIFENLPIRVLDADASKRWLMELFGNISEEELDLTIDHLLDQLTKKEDKDLCSICNGKRVIPGKRDNYLVCPKCFGKMYA